MTARTLQRELVRDLAELFAGRRYKAPDGGDARLQVFSQNLPIRESEDDTDALPYIIVRLDSGGVENQTEPHLLSVLLLVGIYDENPDQQGHVAVLEIMEAIQERFHRNRVLAGQFKFTGAFHWALQQEESFPYYFGAATMEFQAPPPRLDRSELT